VTLKITPLVGPREDFTSNLSPQTLNVTGSRFLWGYSVGINALQNTSSVPTTANLLGCVSELKLKVGTAELQALSLTDAYVLSLLYSHSQPFSVASAGDNQTAFTGSIFCPVMLPRTSSTVTLQADYAAVTNADNTQITIETHSLDGSTGSPPLKISKVSQVTAGTGSTSFNNWNYRFTSEGQVSGLLFKTTTQAGAGTAITAGTIRDVQITVNGGTQIETDFTQGLQAVQNNLSGQHFTDYENSPDNLSIVTPYRWLPLVEPLPARQQINVGLNAGVTAETVELTIIEKIAR
tara:strand:+ start:239 stop:1117 length:879 start_codon:yes stop_codon:yes gene_type:complete